MKEVKSRTGETELQPPEYAPAGPTRIAPKTTEDILRRLEAIETWIAQRTKRAGT